MPRVQLRVYSDPGQAEVFINLKQRDGGDYRLTAIVDTGAEVSLLPAYLMSFVEYRIIQRGAIVIEQAGIARQSFNATEAIGPMFLEDESGIQTRRFGARVWFANTRATLIGFRDVLDQATLHLEMRNRLGWIELD